MSEADGAAEASNSEEGGRIVNLEIQGLEECQYLRTLVDKKMKTVKDLVDKLTEMIPELKESENTGCPRHSELRKTSIKSLIFNF